MEEVRVILVGEPRGACRIVVLTARHHGNVPALHDPCPRRTPANPRPSQPKALVTPSNRLPVPPREWPWSAIGRVNVANGNLSFCTGTLVAPRTVVTAVHCLLVARTNGWVKPDDVHFVVGQTPGSGYLGHSIAASFITSPDFKCTPEDCPLTYSAGAPRQGLRPHMLKADWAIITLQNELSVTPIPS